MHSTFFVTTIFALTLAFASGCHTTENCMTSAPTPATVQPATSCLVLDVSLSTGCGDAEPQLTVINGCADALVFDGTNVQLDGVTNPADAGPVSVAAGDTAVVDVSGTSGASKVTLNATLGSQALVVTFSTE